MDVNLFMPARPASVALVTCTAHLTMGERESDQMYDQETDTAVIVGWMGLCWSGSKTPYARRSAVASEKVESPLQTSTGSWPAVSLICMLYFVLLILCCLLSCV